ncbi:MAG TPA: hypothetical protein VM030_05855 [Acidimicrobiales bacterium]|nr:hypothetical protein [Acidimicrobiales bacterium]
MSTESATTRPFDLFGAAVERLCHDLSSGPRSLPVRGLDGDAAGVLDELQAHPRPDVVVVQCNGWNIRHRGSTPSELQDGLRRLGYRTFLIEEDGTARLRPLGKGEFAPVAVAHIAALMRPGPLPAPWRWGAPLTEDEVVGRIIRTCVDPHPPYREEGAWLVREAAPALAAHRALRVVAEALRDDPDERVRAVARGA